MFPLQSADPASLGLDASRLDLLCATIEKHIARGDHPGAQVAVARHGKLALFRSFGQARLAPPLAAHERTLFLLYSNTKVITACAIWILVEDGLLRYGDRIADHVPGFEKNRKGDITVHELLTHQAGFPSQLIPPAAWTDHALLRELVCDFPLEWAPGTRVQYHPSAAHWTAAVLIEAITGQDYRAYIRDRIIAPLGLAEELFVGVPETEQLRCADMHERDAEGKIVPRALECGAAHRAAGIPGGGGYATARAMAAFYQMLAQGGRLGATRIVSPRTIAHVTRNFTGERIDLHNDRPAHRGLGPHIRGETDVARSIGTLAHPSTFGHGGAGSSYCWADPASGVSFAFLSNTRYPEELHEARMDILCNIAHAAIDA
jgi:CubicO group peptidase (beta-lactamase class C family)